MRSSVEVFDVDTRKARVVWQTERLVEAPNFSRDGRFLVINGDGRLLATGDKTEFGKSAI
jgi:hypothetical protein